MSAACDPNVDDPLDDFEHREVTLESFRSSPAG